MTIDRTWALNCLRHNRNSCVLTLAGLSLLNSPAVTELEDRLVVIRPDEMIFNASESDRTGRRLELPLSQIANDYQNDHGNFMHSLDEQWRHSRRNLIKESFEVVKAYSKETNQLDSLKAMSWHPFARIIRNCVSHDLHFQFNRHDLSTLPVTYLEVEIDATLQGAVMLQSHLPAYVALELHREIFEFVQSH